MFRIYPLARKCFILATNALNFSLNCPHSTAKFAFFRSKLFHFIIQKQNLNILFGKIKQFVYLLKLNVDQQYE